jgi:hypothetical protein
MMTAMQESSKQTFTMLMEVIKSNKSEPAEQKDEVARLKDILEIAREIKGGGNSNKSTAEVIVDAVTPIIGPALNIVANMMAIRAQTPGVQGVPAPVVNGKGNITEMPKQNQPGTIGRAELVAANPNEAAQIINQFKPIILNKLSGEGWEFGAWISEGFGDMTAVAITKYGVGGLMAAAKSVPDFWAQIEASYGEAHLRKWLTSFVNYKEEIAKMEAVEEQEVTGNDETT